MKTATARQVRRSWAPPTDPQTIALPVQPVSSRIQHLASRHAKLAPQVVQQPWGKVLAIVTSAPLANSHRVGAPHVKIATVAHMPPLGRALAPDVQPANMRQAAGRLAPIARAAACLFKTKTSVRSALAAPFKEMEPALGAQRASLRQVTLQAAALAPAGACPLRAETHVRSALAAPSLQTTEASAQHAVLGSMRPAAHRFACIAAWVQTQAGACRNAA